MRRRAFLTGATTAAGLTAVAVPVTSPPSAAADDRAVPRVLSEPASTGGVVRPDRRFDLVAVARAAGAPAGAIRFETADGLGPWQPLDLHTGGRDDREPTASALVRAPRGATGYEVGGDARTAALNLRDGEELRFGGPERATLAADADDGRARRSPGPVRFRTRAGWGADESLRFDEDGNDLWAPVFHRTQLLTVHHTAMATTGDHAADVRGVYRYHAAELGWGDIGYHVLIDPDGVVYEGRHSGEDDVPVFAGRPRPGDARSVTAGHVYGYNHANVGVCLLGDFTDELPTRAALNSLVAVLRVLCAVTSLDPAAEITYVNPDTGARTPGETLSRHRDWLATECPGNAFAAEFDTLVRDRVSGRRRG
ncbi:peptidoglycan recognition family protein [Nocardiopsis sp. NRRL B-16309]|uniref:peptidoglycan recognition protein family protein n=1 Tax=Nocardiopsis sp. NRRL B-16309 TaxID=1519494 RepID=UPI0006AEDDA0|nr:N-acetylmuramoyl-L-alanine amidase [Nocardiopsis sp. NRRL B-16309]KOX17525.1 N-acetylmuramoyl-L-alanine amidase [Nocardiopsis sp. NRRL B-16309]